MKYFSTCSSLYSILAFFAAHFVVLTYLFLQMFARHFHFRQFGIAARDQLRVHTTYFPVNVIIQLKYLLCNSLSDSKQNFEVSIFLRYPRWPAQPLTCDHSVTISSYMSMHWKQIPGKAAYTWIRLCLSLHYHIVCTYNTIPTKRQIVRLYLLTDGPRWLLWPFFIFIKPHLSQPQEQCILHNDHRGPRLNNYHVNLKIYL